MLKGESQDGGPSVWPGGSNIQNGMTIDLGHLNSVTYDATTKLAYIEPACGWGDVYLALEKRGVIEELVLEGS